MRVCGVYVCKSCRVYLRETVWVLLGHSLAKMNRGAMARKERLAVDLKLGRRKVGVLRRLKLAHKVQQLRIAVAPSLHHVADLG